MEIMSQRRRKQDQMKQQCGFKGEKKDIEKQSDGAHEEGSKVQG